MSRAPRCCVPCRNGDSSLSEPLSRTRSDSAHPSRCQSVLADWFLGKRREVRPLGASPVGSGGSATGLSATDAWRSAAVGDDGTVHAKYPLVCLLYDSHKAKLG